MDAGNEMFPSMGSVGEDIAKKLMRFVGNMKLMDETMKGSAKKAQIVGAKDAGRV